MNFDKAPLFYKVIAASRATSIIFVKVVWRSSLVVSSAVIKWSLIVSIVKALTPYLAAKVYKAAVSISTAKVPNLAHCFHASGLSL